MTKPGVQLPPVEDNHQTLPEKDDIFGFWENTRKRSIWFKLWDYIYSKPWAEDGFRYICKSEILKIHPMKDKAYRAFMKWCVDAGHLESAGRWWRRPLPAPGSFPRIVHEIVSPVEVKVLGVDKKESRLDVEIEINGPVIDVDYVDLAHGVLAGDDDDA